MKVSVPAFVGVAACLLVAGCSSSPYNSGYYSYPSRGPAKTSKPPSTTLTATPATNTSKMVALPAVSATNTSKIVTLPAATTTNAVLSPAPRSTVTLVAPSNTSSTVSTNWVQIPATPVVITNLVSVTNKVEVAVPIAQAETEVVNGVHRRAHFRFKDKVSEDAFLQIVAKKQSVLEDSRVIGKLYQEKNAQQQQFSASLQEQFAIKPDKNYQFDAEASTISEIVTPASGSEKARTQLHMKLKDATAVQAFARLTAARRICAEEMASLQLMYREKQMEVGEYDRQLAESYAIVKDRSYQYDQTTKTLFELIKLPDGVEPPKASGATLVK